MAATAVGARAGCAALAAEALALPMAAAVAAVACAAVVATRAWPRHAAAGAVGAAVAVTAAAVASPAAAAWSAVALLAPALVVAATSIASPLALAAVAGAATACATMLPWRGELSELALFAAASLVAAAASWRREAVAVAPRPRAAAVAVAIAPVLAAVAADLAPAAGRVALAGWCAASAAAAALAVGGVRVAFFGLAAAAACSAWLASPPKVAAGEQLLAHAAGEAVLVERASMRRTWRAGDGVRALVGPDRCGDALLAVLAHAATRPGDRILTLGDDGRTTAALRALPERVVDGVDERPWTARLRGAMASVGLVAAGVDDGGLRAGGFEVRVRGLATGARQAIVVAALPTAQGWLHAPAAQRELARVAAGGVVLQPVALDVVDAGVFAAWLAAVADAHAWTGVYRVGAEAVVVGSPSPPAFAEGAWPEAVRWLAHRAHLGDAQDLDAAFVGAVDATRLGAAAPATAADLLAAVCRRAAAVAAPRATSVLAAWRAQQDALDAAVARVRALTDSAEGRAEASALAARFLPIGAPRAELQAALGLVGDAGAPLAEPGRAARRAEAIAPTLFAAAPPVLLALPRPTEAHGPIEDLAALPSPDRLAELAVGDAPLAVALRARFPSPCAHALVAALAAAPLSPAAAQALRELADPFVLVAAAEALPPARLRELIGVWRGGLPMPARLVELARGAADDRRALAVALAGRREASCALALAELLVADEPEVLELAAAAVQLQFEGRVAFDPAAPLSVRRMAAEQVRSLHNRAP